MRTGTNISHYKVGDLIGRGGMGEVYRAVDTRLDRPVALKFLAARFVSDPEAKERFIREAKAASALDHPNICTIHDIGETEEGDLFIVMALYEGDTLERRLEKESFSVERTVYIIRQVAEGLKRAHAGGIVHRDIKPANIAVSEGDAVRLLDFGVAKLQAAESLTQTGTSIGTAVYMSPEQAVGDPVTPASDIWSLGVMAYQMLSGELPFKGEQPLATLHQILSTEPEEIDDLRSEVPRPLAETIHRALAKSARDRFADAAEFLDTLNAAMSEGSAVPDLRPQPLGRNARLGVVLVATAIVVTLGTVFFTQGRQVETVVSEDTRDVIAILPFGVSGAPELAYLSEGLMDLIGGRLDGAGSLRTVDPRAVVSRTAQETNRVMDAVWGAELARDLGAGRFVTGQLVGLGDRVSLSARLHETGSGPDEQPLVTVEGSADSLFVLVDELATNLLQNSLSGANARIQSSAAQSSGSIQATKEFLRGEQFHRRGQFDSASTAYNRALAFDSTFALAHLMKSMNNFNTYDTDDYVAAENALRFSEGLPERDRSLIQAFLDHQGGRLEAAEQRYVAHLKRYPDEVKALLMLGRLYQYSNPRWARPAEQSRPFYERVLELEPENVPSLHNLARLDAGSRHFDSLPARAATLQRVAPGSEWAVDVETMAAFALGDSAAIRDLVETFPEQSLLVRLYAVYNALRFSAEPQDADRLMARQQTGTLNADTGLPDGVTVDTDLSMVLAVMSDLVGGRHEEVRAFLTDPGRSRSPTWDIWDAELVVSDLVPVDSTILKEVLGRVVDVAPGERLRTVFEPLHDIFTPAVAALERDVNVAKLLGRLGRFDEAWEIQRRLADLPPFRAFESLHIDAPSALAADLHYLEGDFQQALEVLRSLPFQLPSTAGSLSITTGSHARHLRAELELELGDPEAARFLFAGLVEGFSPPDKIFLTNAYERLGQIHEAEGRTEDAVYYCEKLVRAWADADAPLFERRETVQARLDALRTVAGAS